MSSQVAYILAWCTVTGIACSAAHLLWALRDAPRRRRLVNLMYPVSQIIVALYTLWAVRAYDLGTATVLVVAACCLICVVYNVFLFRSLRTAEHAGLVAAQADALEEQVAAQEEHLAGMNDNLARMRLLRAQMEEQLGGIVEALDCGDDTETHAHLAEAVDAVRPVRASYCEHPVLDALLTSKAARCEGEGVRFSASVSVPGDLDLPDVEVCAVFANLIDNAVNASLQLKDAAEQSEGGVGDTRAFVEVEAVAAAGCLTICVRNACLDESAASRARGGQTGRHTGKAAGQRDRGLAEHGWGQSIVKILVERHRGSFRTSCENGTYSAEALLYLG